MTFCTCHSVPVVFPRPLNADDTAAVLPPREVFGLLSGRPVLAALCEVALRGGMLGCMFVVDSGVEVKGDTPFEDGTFDAGRRQ